MGGFKATDLNKADTSRAMLRPRDFLEHRPNGGHQEFEEEVARFAHQGGKRQCNCWFREARGQDDLRHSQARRYPLWDLLEFLNEAFRTTSHRCDITFNDDGSWTYDLQTQLLVKGRDQAFDHHNTNTLQLVAAPTLNPLAALLSAGKKQTSDRMNQLAGDANAA